MFGVGADWQAMDKLMLTGSYLYVKNDGNATFGYQAGGITAPPARCRSTSTTSTTASSSTST